MPTLLPVTPGSVTAEERDRLLAQGIVVFEQSGPIEAQPISPDGAIDLPAVLAKFIADLAERMPDACIEVTGTVKVSPACRGPAGGGVPINADGAALHPQTLGFGISGVVFPSRGTLDLFVFVATPQGTAQPAIQVLQLAAMVMAPSASSSLQASTGPWANQVTNSWNLNVYRLRPGGSVGWSALPGGSSVWSRTAHSGE